jgi:hypothetical protein
MIVSFRESIPEQYRQQVVFYFNNIILNGIASSKDKAGMTEQAEYVKSKIADKAKTPESGDR